MQLADALTFRLLPQELEAVASALPSIDITLYQQLMVLSAIFVILFICAAIWLSLRIIGPVVHLKNSMLKIAQGDLTTRVELRHHDAFHDVAHSLNDSTARIQVLVMGLKENIAALENQCQSKAQRQNLAALKQNLAYFDTLHTAEMDS
ncbi:HAMP domain-containing protein [Vibrio stylophorae]|nr:methyl-accepting chemotaxis protein [Vibrio stylophorae]